MSAIPKHSMASKLIGMYLASSIVVLTSFAAIVHYSVKHHFYEQDYQFLYNKYLTVVSELNQPNDRISQSLTSVGGSVYTWFFNPDGKLTFTNSEVSLPSFHNTQSLEWSSGQQDYRAFRFRLSHNEQPSIVLGLNINHHTRFIAKFNTILLWTILITSLVSGIYAVFIVRKGLKPLGKLQHYLNQISTDCLDIRIPADKLPAELSQLVNTQNNMLERLQHGYSRLSEFSSDIAHELRTPLTNIMTQTQVALSAKRPAEEYEDVLFSNVEELERITKTISDTLYLAKSENQLLHMHIEPIELHQEMQSLLDYLGIIAEEKNVSLQLMGTAQQTGDRLMLQRAFSNILSNAIRHSDDNSVISVELTGTGEWNTVSIKNTGETIPEESLPFLFERFYRADKSRQHSASTGAGLGLAIAKSIIQSHGGTITVSSEKRITEFVMTLKAKGPKDNTVD